MTHNSVHNVNARRFIGLGIVGLAVAAAPAFGATIRAASSASSTLHGGDRELNSISFSGTSSTMTGADFLRFSDGQLYWGGASPQTFGWNAAISRDMNTSGNRYIFNPDRADNASSFAVLEAASQGTLAQVFGPFHGYKNMSYILDGEEVATPYHVDLLFGETFKLSGDADSQTVEVALLERGRNSDMNLYGLLGGGGVTAPLHILRNQMGPKLWSLDTLEIDGNQDVGGVGISIDPSWADLIGLRVESAGTGFGGPDLVGVGVVNYIPEPASLTLLGLAAAALGARRRG